MISDVNDNNIKFSLNVSLDDESLFKKPVLPPDFNGIKVSSELKFDLISELD